MVLICIFLVTSHVEHLVMCLLAMYISSLEKCLVKSFVNFRIGLFGFFVVEYISFEYWGTMGQELNGTNDVLRCLRCAEV